jgi:aryl-alcohol dehydrogenase-like predicted oxidoreductase
LYLTSGGRSAAVPLVYARAVAETVAGLRLGWLGYGATNVGNLYRPMTDDDAWAVLETAWESGIRCFDTAPHYGLGLSERRLGSFLATKPRADHVVTTKVGPLLRPRTETAYVLDDANHLAVPVTAPGVGLQCRRHGANLEESLERLGLSDVDVLYLHHPDEHDQSADLSTGVPALAALCDEGLVTAIGIGSKSTKALVAAVRTGALDFAMVAGRYTLLDQPALDDFTPACRAGGSGWWRRQSSTRACCLGATRTTRSPRASRNRSNAPETCRQSSIADTRSRSSARAHISSLPKLPSRTGAVSSPRLRAVSASTAPHVCVFLCASVPTTIMSTVPSIERRSGLRRRRLTRG